MKLRIISVGHKMPDWVQSACIEYIKRMPREMSVEIIEIKPDKRASGKNSAVVQEAEAKRILEAAGRDYLVALDERGQEVSTLQLAERMKTWLGNGRDISLVIGGADGLHEDIKQRADWLWSLSRLTMPHGMVRVMLSEQLYRAHSVISNHPYHRE
ncbi:23S rRNA (pseudouridine(1915)-N(3))-methyltransferase RlmH [Methylobacillus caricis]|uniref:23S rRNA (pseudouridine(1915)-N(3))-methyltransferase RlmH n=1 Tax=Methylobacillus caricis TaxID=1971611 RepID=UPI001CFFD321|nr:23S rRNA (pseudouridine(1915)-N(3))-methyltransferase RlmH [Methylobacillus caricis]MCB5186671.1 23S rRNA (pseudouridine(1915)-N(3))-methyltransferase RlmH [Methylobacillus caricis]